MHCSTCARDKYIVKLVEISIFDDHDGKIMRRAFLLCEDCITNLQKHLEPNIDEIRTQYESELDAMEEELNNLFRPPAPSSNNQD